VNCQTFNGRQEVVVFALGNVIRNALGDGGCVVFRGSGHCQNITWSDRVPEIEGTIVNDATLKSIVVSIIALSLFVIWNLSEHQAADCTNNCATDLSAVRR
jgi:hypothetical protein